MILPSRRYIPLSNNSWTVACTRWSHYSRANQRVIRPKLVRARVAQPVRYTSARQRDGKRGRCSLSRGDHYILFCDAYQGKTVEERKQHVEESKLCLNCLGKHKLSECSSKKTCSTCSE